MNKKKVYSAMRPTGKLHLGHLVGALDNWLKFQEEYDCVFGVADWHALMGEYENSKVITGNTVDMVVDWLACGLDPDRVILYVQSQVPEHLELQMIFSCLTPLGWLERNPTYKEQLREVTTRDLQTYGFLGYPVLQAADILLFRANAVPIGEDQLPHLELTREISRRFNHIFKTEYFEDCDAILTKTPRLPGFDGRKMSKSYNNAIDLSDSPENITKKIKGMFTDPNRLRIKDPGNPDECNLFKYFYIFKPEVMDEVRDGCVKATRGCMDCKKILTEAVADYLAPIREKRLNLEKKPDQVLDILEQGRKKASAIAKKTLEEIKEIIF